MKVEFSRLDERKAISIGIEGRLSTQDVIEMRRQTVVEANETGYSNYIVDIRNLQSIDNGNTGATFDLGDQFNDIGFSVWTNTAVLMPQNEEARRQVEFLHIVEINRGRGLINYVESYEEAFEWFDEMARRVASHM